MLSCIVCNTTSSAYGFLFNAFSASALHLSLCPLHVYRLYTTYGAKRQRLCFARLGFSTVYVTLCLRYSMYWFPRYNVSFRQHFCVRQPHGQGQGQGHPPDQDQGQGHLSNSDEEGGIARRRVPRRTSSEIASAKIAGRPIPVKVSQCVGSIKYEVILYSKIHILQFFTFLFVVGRNTNDRSIISFQSSLPPSGCKGPMQLKQTKPTYIVRGLCFIFIK